MLTSATTVSGGEDMAYNIRAFGRGPVVGQHHTTAGAANPVHDLQGFCDDEFGKCWWVAPCPI